MKTTKELADELVEKFRPHADTWNYDRDYLKCAILSVEHAISVIDSLHDDMSENLDVLAKFT